VEKERPKMRKRELAQQAVPSSSSWSPGVVAAAAFIVLNQNKGKYHRVVPGDLQCGLHLADLAHLCPLPSPALYT
uniref:Uncharacterized protein n=1 Tax=Panthera leo TaxID=9689 RepID=A0A8C8WSV3_PANLE